MPFVKAYYYIDKRKTSMSCNVQNFTCSEDADNAAWLCATMPGCVSAQVVEVTSGGSEPVENIVHVYARGLFGVVEDFAGLAEALRQLREAGAEFTEVE